MPLDTWVMMGNWSFLDQFEIHEFLDKMEEAGVRHLAFGAPLPLEPDPRNYTGKGPGIQAGWGLLPLPRPDFHQLAAGRFKARHAYTSVIG